MNTTSTLKLTPRHQVYGTMGGNSSDHEYWTLHESIQHSPTYLNSNHQTFL